MGAVGAAEVEAEAEAEAGLLVSKSMPILLLLQPQIGQQPR